MDLTIEPLCHRVSRDHDVSGRDASHFQLRSSVVQHLGRDNMVCGKRNAFQPGKGSSVT